MPRRLGFSSGKLIVSFVALSLKFGSLAIDSQRSSCRDEIEFPSVSKNSTVTSADWVVSSRQLESNAIEAVFASNPVRLIGGVDSPAEK